jgi:hypothetical protein
MQELDVSGHGTKVGIQAKVRQKVDNLAAVAGSAGAYDTDGAVVYRQPTGDWQ